MIINFLVPTIGLTGGVKVIFQHANNLAKWGHEIRIICPYVLDINAGLADKAVGFLKLLKRSILLILNLNKINWFALNNKILIIRPWNLSGRRLPSADVTVATANQTADWLARAGERCGKKFYFIQDYENWTRRSELVDATWRLPLEKIVISEYLARLAKEKFNQEVNHIVADGVDTKIFFNHHKIYHQQNILMMYHILEKKGFADGLAAFRLAKEKYPQINLKVFGAYPLKKNFLEGEYYLKPSAEKLRELYSTADIFVWPSRIEGFGLPPLEAMACRSAVISTDTGAIREYAVPDQTVLLAPPARPDLLAERIGELLSDNRKLQKISEAGYNRIKDYDLEASTKKLEKILIS